MPRPVTCKGSLVNIVFRLTFVERRYTVRHKNVYRSQPASVCLYVCMCVYVCVCVCVCLCVCVCFFVCACACVYMLVGYCV